MFLSADRFQSEDDLLNERGYDAQTGQMTQDAMTIDRRENGGLMIPPNGSIMVPPPNEYESYEDLKNQQQQQQQHQVYLLTDPCGPIQFVHFSSTLITMHEQPCQTFFSVSSQIDA